MRAADVVAQLQVKLPQLTDSFTTDVSVASLARSGSVVTAVCNQPHRLKRGGVVAIKGATTPIPISSLTKSGGLATLVTATDHDLTNPVAETIRITGATEAQFNGTFTRINVVNRRTISFTVPDTSIFSFDNQLAKFFSTSFIGLGQFPSTLSNESTIVAPVQSLGSLKVIPKDNATLVSVGSNQVGGIGGVKPVDVSASTELSFWLRPDAVFFSNMTAVSAVVIKISSTILGSTDFNEYSFDKSLFTADTWTQLFIDIVNDVPSATSGTVDLTKIISMFWRFTPDTDFGVSASIYFDDMDKGMTIASGSPVLLDAESALRSYNQTFQVESTPSASIFTFAHAVTTLPDPTGTIVARVNPRISAAITVDRAIQAYTQMTKKDRWLFVVLGDVVASKSRQIASDAIDNLQRGNEFRQQIIQPFSLFVFFPVEDETAARLSRDDAELLFGPLCRSVLFSSFDSGLHVGAQHPVQYAGHGVFRYDTAVYIHGYEFQQVADLVFEDTVGPDLDVAFRDIDLTLFPDPGGATGASFLDVDIDLDEVPLP